MSDNHLSIKRLREILELGALRLPDKPPLVEIRVNEYVDSTEDEALDVQLVFQDSLTSEQLGWKHIQPVELVVRAALQEAGETRWPYFTIGKESEFGADDGEAGAAA